MSTATPDAPTTPITPTKIIKAIAYLRFSPRRNSDLCESNEIQLSYIRDYCTKRGYDLTEVYADEDLSGDDEDRPGLWDAIHALSRGAVLVVYKAERLARSVLLSELIHRDVRKRRATIEAVEGSKNGESAEDVFVRQILSAVSELDKKVIAARTKAAMLRHQANGRAMGSIPPFGMRRGNDKLVIDAGGKAIEQRQWIDDPGERETINRIIAERTLGKGYREIARVMQAENRWCRGKVWNHMLVRSICRREGLGV